MAKQEFSDTEFGIDPNRNYDTKEAAPLLGLQPCTLEAARCRGGGGPRYFKAGRLVKYPGRFLIAYIEATSVRQNL